MRADLKPGRTAMVIVLVAACVAGDVEGQVVGSNTAMAVPCSYDVQPRITAQGNLLLAAWRSFCGNNYLVRASASQDGGTTWQELPDAPYQGIPSSPIAVCSGDSGRFYLVAPTLTPGAYFRVEAFEGRFAGSVFEWRRLGDPLPPPNSASDEARTIAIQRDPVSGNLYVTFTNAHPPDPEGAAVLFHDERSFPTFARSTDGGQTWEPPIELAGMESMGPKLVIDPSGDLIVFWENYLEGKLKARKSTDFGASFGPEFDVAPMREPVMVPTSWDNDLHLRRPSANSSTWCNFITPPGFAVGVDRSSGPRRGAVYVVSSEHATGTIGPKLADRSETEPNDSFATASTIEVGDDMFGIAVYSEEGGKNPDFFRMIGVEGQSVWMGVDFNPGDAPFGVNFNCAVAAQPARVGCIDFTGPAAVYTFPRSGTYVAGANPLLPRSSASYRLSLREFIVDPGSVARDHRDLLIRSSTDGGVTWSEQVRVGDGPVGSEEALPEVAVDEEGRVHVAWYDKRGSECGDVAHTYWTYSDDGGQTFAPPLQVSAEPSYWNTVQRNVGDHLDLAVEDGNAYVVWTGISPESYAQVLMAKVTDVPTSVLISGLRAEARNGGAELSWRAGDDRGVIEYRIHRAAGAGGYAQVGAVAPRGRGEYRWRDASVVPGAVHRYRLEVARRDQASLWEGPIEVEFAVRPLTLGWRGAAPNPFSSTIELELATPEVESTQVTVFNVKGEEVARLVPRVEGGRTLVRWTGRDDRGRLVAPGVYLVRARSGSLSVVRQIVRMK